MKKKMKERAREGKRVRWCDPENTKVYGSGEGPFLVARIALDIWAPICTCGGKGTNLLDGGHSMFCEMQFDQVEGLAVTVVMNGRHCTFSEDLFEVVEEK